MVVDDRTDVVELLEDVVEDVVLVVDEELELDDEVELDDDVVEPTVVLVEDEVDVVDVLELEEVELDVVEEVLGVTEVEVVELFRGALVVATATDVVEIPRACRDSTSHTIPSRSTSSRLFA